MSFQDKSPTATEGEVSSYGDIQEPGEEQVRKSVFRHEIGMRPEKEIVRSNQKKKPEIGRIQNIAFGAGVGDRQKSDISKLDKSKSIMDDEGEVDLSVSIVDARKDEQNNVVHKK